MIDYKCEPDMCKRCKGRLIICEDCLRLIEDIERGDKNENR